MCTIIYLKEKKIKKYKSCQQISKMLIDNKLLSYLTSAGSIVHCRTYSIFLSILAFESDHVQKNNLL